MNNEREKKFDALRPRSLQELLRAVAASLGALAIVLGLGCLAWLFVLLASVLRHPEIFRSLLDKWSAAVGAEQLDVVLSETTYHPAGIVAMLILGGGCLVLAWISMGMLRAGVKTVSWILSDREAVKRLLVHAFGSAKGPNASRSTERTEK